MAMILSKPPTSNASDLTAGEVHLDRLPATLTGKDADTVDTYTGDQVLPELTVAIFQRNTATGTMSNPGNINNGNVGVGADADVVGEYTDIVWTKKRCVSEYRHYGVAGYTGDGTWKIQHWDGSAWVDNTTGIATRATADWSAWTALTTEVFTTKIRIIATALDSFEDPDKSWMMDLEMRAKA